MPSPHWDDDGCLRLQARLPATDGALLLRALAQNEATEESTDRPPRDCGHSVEDAVPLYEINHHDRPEHEPVDARQADALVATARAALEARSTVGGNSDSCELIVHVDLQTLAGDELRERCEIENGPVIAPETIRRLGCDAAVVRIIERDGQPLSVGRRTRAIPPALRRALRSRDGGCRFPGCTHRRYLHAHHIEHWARGGETNLDNLVQLCSYHHRLVHEGGYTVQCAGAGGRSLRFRRPNGQIVPDRCRGGRARGATIIEQDRWLGLSIDAQTCAARSAGQPWDYHMTVDGLVWLVEQDP